jgi:hypothetical protein
MNVQKHELWVAGTARDDDGTLAVVIQSFCGKRSMFSLQNVQATIGTGSGVRRKAHIRLDQLQKVSTAHYLDAVGLGHLEHTGQATYEALTDIGTLVIPGQLLIVATLANQISLRAVLLSPVDPSNLMMAMCTETGFEMQSPHQRLLTVQPIYEAISERLQWIQTYPSARAAWGSVHRHALDGVFDMRMPRASILAVFQAKSVDGKYYVTKLTVTELTPIEPPMGRSRSAAQKFVFHDGAQLRPRHGKAATPTGDERLGGGSSLSMSDEQWSRVEHILNASLPESGRQGGRLRTYCRRDLVQAMLLKLGTPCSWSKVPVPKSVAQGASVLLSKLQRAGVWDGVVSALG